MPFVCPLGCITGWNNCSNEAWHLLGILFIFSLRLSRTYLKNEKRKKDTEHSHYFCKTIHSLFEQLTRYHHKAHLLPTMKYLWKTLCVRASLSLPRMELPWLLAPACLFQWETKRKRERCLVQCGGSRRVLNCIMAVLHRDFIKAIQSLVFEHCGIFGCAKVLRDLPFKSDMERQNKRCSWAVNENSRNLKYVENDTWPYETLWSKVGFFYASLTYKVKGMC